VDPEVPKRHETASTQIIRIGKTLYMVALCHWDAVPPGGITFYTSDDPLKDGWKFRGWIFHNDQLRVCPGAG